MAVLKIKNVEIKGMAVCLPANVEENKEYPYFAADELDRMLPTIGIERRHVAAVGVTTSDLCLKAAEKLISDLKWKKEDIDLLIFASPARDYIEPDTACILQDRLGLSKNAMCFDMTLGCTAWTYGINVVASILSSGFIKKAILLNGDLPSKSSSYTDKTLYPLFSDTGAATALEYNENATGFISEIGTDGSGYEAIITKDGGVRHPFTAKSLEVKNYGEGINRTDMNLSMNGMDVFAFALKTAPKSVNALLDYAQYSVEDIDYYFFHQANLYMDKKIAKKLKLPEYKVPFCLKDYGNAGGASIPLVMITQKAKELRTKKLRNVACAFGVGLSWASVCFETNRIVCSDLIYY